MTLATESPAAAFLDHWHAAIEAREVERLRALMAPECALLSPVVWTPKTDPDEIIFLLGCVIEVIEGFAYRHETVDGLELSLEFVGAVDGKSLVGIDRISLDADGRMTRIEVLIRPLNGLMLFADAMTRRWEAWAAARGRSAAG